MLRADDAEQLVDKLAGLSAKDRAKLPGVSGRRAPQLLAGAIVASTTLSLLGIEEIQICPWALREGVILRRVDHANGSDETGTAAAGVSASGEDR